LVHNEFDMTGFFRANGKMVGDVISYASLAISIGALVISARSAYHDRGRLKTTSCLCWEDDTRLPAIQVGVVNLGRRPVILTSLGGDCSQSQVDPSADGAPRMVSHSMVFPKPITLSENQKFRITIPRKITGTDALLTDFWLEDTTGKHHRIRDAKFNLSKYYELLKRPPCAS
jgi:hypothetical protein